MAGTGAIALKITLPEARTVQRRASQGTNRDGSKPPPGSAIRADYGEGRLWGHKYLFPSPNLNGRCPLGEATFARMGGRGEMRREPPFGPPWVNEGKSTLNRRYHYGLLFNQVRPLR
jgi:hypothetical protein